MGPVPVRVGVKYCGGCREQYGRKAAFEKARERVADGTVEFLKAEDGGVYDALLVLCGCPSRCADISGYRAGEVIMVDSKEGLNCLSKKFITASW